MTRVMKLLLVTVEKRNGMITNILVSIRFVICVCSDGIINPLTLTSELQNCAIDFYQERITSLDFYRVEIPLSAVGSV